MSGALFGTEARLILKQGINQGIIETKKENSTNDVSGISGYSQRSKSLKPKVQKAKAKSSKA